MESLAKIMVVVDTHDNSSRRSGALPIELSKALRLVAEKDSTELLLFSCGYDAGLESRFYKPGYDSSKIQEEFCARSQDQLAVLVDQLQGLHYKASAEVAWTSHCEQKISRKAEEAGVDLIVKHARSHFRLDHRHLSMDSWQLARHCSRPLLIVGNDSWPTHPVLIAAIDPPLSEPRSTSLEDQILTSAVTLKNVLEGELHALNAYHGSGRDYVDVEKLAEEHDKAFSSAVARYNFESDKLHLVDACPVVAVAQASKKLKADITVIGTVSNATVDRSRVGDTPAEMGSTSERILDSTVTDVLLVRPVV